MNDIQKYYEKYNNLENQIDDIQHNSEYYEILSTLKEDLSTIKLNKDLVNKSKSLMIKINKSKNIIQEKKTLEKYINKKIKQLDSNNIQYLNSIIKKYKEYFHIDYDTLNSKIESIIFESTHFKYLDFYSTINSKKSKQNNLQKLISCIKFSDPSIFDPKIIFLENFNTFDSFNSISSFITKFNFIQSNLSQKMLKRGFIFETKRNYVPYILKYQPNKSFMEILINKYISKYPYLKENILIPNYFFINKNNSYFYIIQKYDTDLFSYVKKKKDPMTSNEILFILKSLINVIFHLHKINIIYADVKLENFVVNTLNGQINDIKLIDFDVSLFDELPSEFSEFDFKIQKLLNNKKPRGTKLYMANNDVMKKSNDIYSISTFIILLLYKNIIKILKHNKQNLSENLLSKILKRLNYFKNNLENDLNKKKLIKYIFRIYNDKRFKHYWNNDLHIKTIYQLTKKCIDQNIDIIELYSIFN